MKKKVIVYLLKTNEVGNSYRLLEVILKKEMGLVLNNLKIIKNSFGKVSIKNFKIHFNISHSKGLIICAFYDDEIGVDVEFIRDYNPLVLNKNFSKEEQMQVKGAKDSNKAFFSFWTLKESFVKNIGIGLSYGLKNIQFNIKGKLIESNKEYFFKLYEILDNYIMAICTKENVEQIELKEVDIVNERIYNI